MERVSEGMTRLEHVRDNVAPIPTDLKSAYSLAQFTSGITGESDREISYIERIATLTASNEAKDARIAELEERDKVWCHTVSCKDKQILELSDEVNLRGSDLAALREAVTSLVNADGPAVVEMTEAIKAASRKIVDHFDKHYLGREQYWLPETISIHADVMAEEILTPLRQLLKDSTDVRNKLIDKLEAVDGK